MNSNRTDITFSPVWSEVRGQLLRISSAVLLFSVIYNILILAIPIYSLQIFDRITISQSYETLVMLLIAVSICVVGAVLFDSLRRHLSTRISENTYSSLLQYCLNLRGRRAMTQLSDSESSFGWRDFKKLCDGLKSPITTTLSDAIISPLILVILFFLAWEFALVMIAINLLMMVICYCQAKVFSMADTASAQENSKLDLSWFDSEYLNAWSQNRHQDLTQQTVGKLLQGEQLDRQQRKLSHRLSTTISALRYIGQILVPTIGAYLLIEQKITAGTLLAAIMLSMRSLISWEQVFHNSRQLVEVCSGFRKLKHSLAKDLDDGRSQQTPITPLSGNLSILPAGADSDQQLSIATGSITAVIGPTGAGKSQLLHSLLGLDSTASPKMTVHYDGIEVNNLKRDSFSDIVSVISTSAVRPEISVKEFIAGHHQLDTEELQRACHLSGLDRRISALPLGYDTVISKHPLTQAAGFFNLIQLARSIYSRPKFLYIDDIDSQLDKAGLESFEALIKEMHSMSVTCVFTTQRKSLLHLCDQVLLVDKQKIFQFSERDLSRDSSQSYPDSHSIGREA